MPGLDTTNSYINRVEILNNGSNLNQFNFEEGIYVDDKLILYIRPGDYSMSDRNKFTISETGNGIYFETSKQRHIINCRIYHEDANIVKAMNLIGEKALLTRTPITLNDYYYLETNDINYTIRTGFLSLPIFNISGTISMPNMRNKPLSVNGFSFTFTEDKLRKVLE